MASKVVRDRRVSGERPDVAQVRPQTDHACEEQHRTDEANDVYTCVHANRCSLETLLATWGGGAWRSSQSRRVPGRLAEALLVPDGRYEDIRSPCRSGTSKMSAQFLGSILSRVPRGMK